MAAQNVCSFFKYGYCKHGEFCRRYHEKTICDKQTCDVFSCTFRHPVICKFYKEYKRCKFNPCSYKHEDDDSSLEIPRKESVSINEKLCKVIEDIENLTRKEKASEGNIEKLKMLESTVIKQSEKIQNLEDKLKDTDLKVF